MARHRDPSNNVGVVTGILLLILSWSFGLLLTYYLYKFYELRDKIIYIKRRGDIVIAYTLCMIVCFIFGWPFIFIVHWDWNLVHPHKDNVSYVILSVLNDLLFNPFFNFTVFLTLIRYWLIYYDIKFSKCNLNLEWKQCISSNIKVLSKEKWYIQHRSDYGNQSWLLKRLLIVPIISSLTTMTLALCWDFGILNQQLWHWPNLFVFITTMILILWLSRKLFNAKFDDNIHLYKEARMISFAWIISICLYAIASIITFITKERVLWILFLSTISGMVGGFVTTFVSTWWVVRQVQRMKRDDEQLSLHMQSSQLSLKEILKEKKSFKLYMKHLIKEFSMECLISLIEFIQFREHIIQVLDVDDAEVMDSVEYRFPENVPLSDIVHSRDDENDTLSDLENANGNMRLLKAKVYRLYCKYIEVGSAFEINLAYKTRSGFVQLMGDEQEWMDTNIDKLELIKIFDSCIYEMKKLLDSSKHRFKYEK